MNYLIVRLWGDEIGRLCWDYAKRISYFTFNPEHTQLPDLAPLTVGIRNRHDIPIFGDSRRIYQNLPPFIADSLPDSWGNKLFDRWVRQNKIPRNHITPLYKLMFIGRRGMGALEFEPEATDLMHSKPVDLKSLYDLSLEIQNERDSAAFNISEIKTLETLMSVGTSAGGRQMKAIIAVNHATQEIRSGQVNCPKGFEYYIIKFEDSLVPTSEIEMAFHEMAKKCGITMTECRMINIDGTNHFLTRRFDRENGEKLHMQTLAAMNPEAESYEDLMETCQRLRLSHSEITQVYRRLVFNVLSNNTDDHNKNFSFLLPKAGKWKLAPAYDMTFIFNIHATGPQPTRCMSIFGKIDNISKEDLLEFASIYGIRNAASIIKEVAHALGQFEEWAVKYDIPTKWSSLIAKTIHKNLKAMGLIEENKRKEDFTDSLGRPISSLKIKTNTKGYYEISAFIDGRKSRRFIKPSNELFYKIQEYELDRLPPNQAYALFEDIFS